ncbi:MAG: hypothetical protein HSCHL_2165 [Hydrogenibacillus schlegelii]|uniref:Uncharacterized protein n=1 Tax=Hydrogenibacillus schlegelii TaxID=1484 RepID=A0A2T5G9W7_HYDSH|nr:MAG: hypothetical protein HSCHL_2165 [Hydrogenibacillus schlegelii]
MVLNGRVRGAVGPRRKGPLWVASAGEGARSPAEGAVGGGRARSGPEPETGRRGSDGWEAATPTEGGRPRRR